MRRKVRVSLILTGVVCAALILALVLFPGQRLGIAFTVGTGLGLTRLQAKIDDLEAKAIAPQTFSEEDRAFLTDFYRTLATGAKLTVILGQTGRLMDHYLDGSGVSYRLDPSIFATNQKVKSQMSLLRARALQARCRQMRLSSSEFYMPDRSNLDSVFGLYYGRLHLLGEPDGEQGCTWRWRAEVPWNWPSYASLKEKHGSVHAERFPLPNVKCLLFGKRYCLHVGNGLGEYLTQLGLAKSFLAYAEWPADISQRP